MCAGAKESQIRQDREKSRASRGRRKRWQYLTDLFYFLFSKRLKCLKNIGMVDSSDQLGFPQ